MSPTLRDVNESAEHKVSVVFNSIRSAAMLIEAIDPVAVLESWNHQETILPITDPTAYQKILAARDDMRRKKDIIEAAAQFLKRWNEIKAEALAALEDMG